MESFLRGTYSTVQYSMVQYVLFPLKLCNQHILTDPSTITTRNRTTPHPTLPNRTAGHPQPHNHLTTQMLTSSPNCYDTSTLLTHRKHTPLTLTHRTHTSRITKHSSRIHVTHHQALIPHPNMHPSSLTPRHTPLPCRHSPSSNSSHLRRTTMHHHRARPHPPPPQPAIRSIDPAARPPWYVQYWI